MKKSLVALAVLAATGAYAQSSVTLYGIVEATVDVGYKNTQDINSTVSGFNAAGAAIGGGGVGTAGAAPSLLAPTYSAVGGLLYKGTIASTGTTTTRNSLQNRFRVQDGSDQGTGSSRIGFRGTEDLGGGLKANFQLEMSIRVDDGCTTVTAVPGGGCDNGGNSGPSGGSSFGRNAWGGISGNFGEVRLGRQVLGSFGVQANSGASGASNGLYDATTAAFIPMGGIRFSNAIRYLSPNLGGFTGSIMFAAPELGAVNPSPVAVNSSTIVSAPNVAAGGNLVTTTSNSRRTGIDLALEYANGPAYIGFGYNKRDAGVNFSGSNQVTPAGFALSNNPNTGTITAYTLGGSYDLGVVKPFLNYTRQTTNAAITTTSDTGSTATSSSLASSSNQTARAYSIGLRAPIGPFTIITGYGNARTSTSARQVATEAVGFAAYGQGTQVTNRAFQFGTQYALSKRTLLEANYGYARVSTNIDSTASGSNFMTYGLSTTPGASTAAALRQSDRISSFNVGLKHSF